MFIRVDLPDPDAPVSATSSPRLIESETPLSTGTSCSPRWYVLQTSSRVMSSTAGDLARKMSRTINADERHDQDKRLLPALIPSLNRAFFCVHRAVSFCSLLLPAAEPRWGEWIARLGGGVPADLAGHHRGARRQLAGHHLGHVPVGQPELEHDRAELAVLLNPHNALSRLVLHVRAASHQLRRRAIAQRGVRDP